MSRGVRLLWIKSCSWSLVPQPPVEGKFFFQCVGGWRWMGLCANVRQPPVKSGVLPSIGESGDFLPC